MAGIDIGTLSLAKAFAGTSEVIKAILNGVTLYEKTFYPITVTLTNATAASGNPSTIAQGGTATLVFTFDETTYICPSTSPTVTGATGVWTKNSDSQGTMVLSNANGNVSFTVAGEQALPQLDTPTNLSVTDNVASFDEVENAESYEFYVDDVSIGTYTAVTGYQVTVTNDTGIAYDLYDGQDSTGIFLGSLASFSADTYSITSGYIYIDSVQYLLTNGTITANPYEITTDTSLSVVMGGASN